VKLQPLRIPTGWHIVWNTLFEVDPSGGKDRQDNTGGSSLFSVISEERRSYIEVAWRPEFDPNGCYRLIVMYSPWPRTPKGRRFKGAELEFDWSNPIHQLETRSHAELVKELEGWLEDCPRWAYEAS
jgi:hypothetical protein